MVILVVIIVGIDPAYLTFCDDISANFFLIVISVNFLGIKTGLVSVDWLCPTSYF